MTKGLLTLTYTDSGRTYALDCGTVTTINDDIKAEVLVTPIVTYTADNAFAFDNGATETLSFSIKRRNPANALDLCARIGEGYLAFKEITWENTTQWSNRTWKVALCSLIDRWQMRTDGCNVKFTPIVQVDGQDIYQKTIDVNGYLKTLSITYDTTSHELLNVSLTIVVGSMGKV